MTLFYILAVVALGFHLRHGIWSARCSTLGQSSDRRERRAEVVSTVSRGPAVAGFLAVPFAVTIGVV